MKKINCIMLVDDNPGDNEYHQIIIKEADVCNQVRIAKDGIEALDYLKKAADPNNTTAYPKPDLIFLDINMPKMNGFEFLEKYNKLDPSLKSKVTIIMLTTSLNPDDEKKTREHYEVTGFQNKPLTVEMLHSIVDKYF